MNASDPAGRAKAPTRSPGADHTGALVLGLLALAAFCGWYIMVGERPSDEKPLPVFQQPLMPPSTTDIPSDVPGHTHYTVVSPHQDEVEIPGKP